MPPCGPASAWFCVMCVKRGRGVENGMIRCVGSVRIMSD